MVQQHASLRWRCFTSRPKAHVEERGMGSSRGQQGSARDGREKRRPAIGNARASACRPPRPATSAPRLHLLAALHANQAKRHGEEQACGGRGGGRGVSKFQISGWPNQAARGHAAAPVRRSQARACGCGRPRCWKLLQPSALCACSTSQRHWAASPKCHRVMYSQNLSPIAGPVGKWARFSSMLHGEGAEGARGSAARRAGSLCEAGA